MPLRLLLAALALLAVSGCAPDSSAAPASTAAPPTWTREPGNAPWFMSGLTPTADSIAYALYDDVYEIDGERCPFHLYTCARANIGGPADFAVSAVRCRPLAEYEESCTFRLLERHPGVGAIASRCKGRFEIVGTSEEPSRWGVKYNLDDETPLIVCRRLSR
jgi:hypothetical protein